MKSVNDIYAMQAAEYRAGGTAAAYRDDRAAVLIDSKTMSRSAAERLVADLIINKRGESISSGHPDKIAEAIAFQVVDTIYGLGLGIAAQ